MYIHLWKFPSASSLLFPTSPSSRQQEIEEKLIEEETARRVEELVAKRVEEELEKRKDEIEREVLRRVEEAKRIMERQLLEELERQRQAELAAQKAREVTLGRLECILPPFVPSPAPPLLRLLLRGGTFLRFQRAAQACFRFRSPSILATSVYRQHTG